MQYIPTPPGHGVMQILTEHQIQLFAPHCPGARAGPESYIGGLSSNVSPGGDITTIVDGPLGPLTALGAAYAVLGGGGELGLW
jgi:hypothetical protein